MSMEMNFCRRCGKEITEVAYDTYRCGAGHTQFRSPAPTASVVLVDGDKLVMSRRAIHPNIGMVDFFGGFLESGETLEAGAIRELEEELGVTPEAYSELAYLGSYASTYRYEEENRPIMGSYFVANLKSGTTLSPADDCAEVVYMPIEKVDWSVISEGDAKVALKDVLELLQKQR